MDKLGIYIPTYNRAKELKECLDRFIPQIKKYRLPIYIADSSESNTTKKLIIDMRKRYPKIFYKKNSVYKKNTYALALKNVLEMDNTEFVWFFGDDDTIKAGTIRKIMSKLDKYDYLQINSEVFSRDMKRCIKGRIIQKYKDEVYENPDDALLNTEDTGYQGFMAHMIIKKNSADLQIKDLDVTEPHMDFLHTIIFYRAISSVSNDKKVIGLLIASPLINNRGANWGYSSRIMEIYFKSWNKTHNMLVGYYPAQILKRVRIRSITNLMIPLTINKIANNTSALLDYKKYILDNKDINLTTKAILFIGTITPKSMLRIIYNLYKIFKGY